MDELELEVERYRTLVEVSPEAAFVVRDGIIQYVNPAAVKLFRVPSADVLLGTPILAMIHPEFHELAVARRRIVLELGVPAPLIEMRFVTLEGEEYEVEVQATAITFQGERAIYCAVRDISARKQAERELRESEARFRTMFREAPLGVAMVDSRTGRLLEVNERFAEIAGQPTDVLCEATWMHITHAEDVAEYCRLLTEMTEGVSTSFSREQRYVRADGTAVWVSLTATRFSAGNQTHPCHLCMVQDITHRRQLEEHVRQAQKLEAVGRLAGGIAHDFNNALAVILGHTEFALQDVEPQHPLHSDLLEIQKAAQHSANLTRQLLTYARRQAISPRPLNLNTSIENALRMLTRLIGENIALQWTPSPELWPVTMDPSQVDQILTNLCANARDAIVDVGTLSVATANCTLSRAQSARIPESEPGDYVRLTVSDNGRGMSRDVIDKVFEPFFTTKDVGEGTGLGLSMVYGIIRQNAGAITIDSAPGRGTTFDLYFPRALGVTQIAELADATPLDPRGTESVMVVEDEAEILNLTTRALIARGYTVLPAHGPEAALQLAESYPAPIELILTDIMMPGMSGPDLVTAVSAMRPNIRRLFMSGFTADLMAQRGVLDADTAFLAKPFTLAALSSKVREVLDVPTRESAT